ncbi:hypothetical protein ACFWWM_07250 [Streptomyces sp. NPDC058682]|uniref:hypothetical protein n=1 Tax=Streptomyces sp. NPDC058682 TaxID=3346596 RepID=UPI00364A0FB3
MQALNHLDRAPIRRQRAVGFFRSFFDTGEPAAAICHVCRAAPSTLMTSPEGSERAVLTCDGKYLPVHSF